MELAGRLREDARRANERRVLVLAGSPERTRERAVTALESAGIPDARATYVGPSSGLPWDRVAHRAADRLLGTTQEAVVLDCQAACYPNALGQTVGAVDGGGLLVVLTPSLDTWPDRRDEFDATLAVPPFSREQVSGNFRRRLVRTLRAHRGVAIVDVDTDTVEDAGLIEGPPRCPAPTPSVPAEHTFPGAAYEACLTRDQVDALAAYEALLDDRSALVVEADRGRGKSSVAGLAAAALAARGVDVLVTAPQRRSVGELFARAAELLSTIGVDATRQDDRIETDAGRIVYERPPDATPTDADCVIVDEAAALPVGTLERMLVADSVAFSTTVHGYEGAGRGFTVRFRERLAETDHAVTEVRLDEPIRYAPGDPVEVWAFRALCLGARPATEQLLSEARPATVSYRELTGADLIDDEHLLREAFGLLVVAHYRTEPNDLARLLDAPNVTTRVLLHDGHVVSVALLAREGNLSADLRARIYEGERVRGNLLPDLLTSQLRDEAAGETEGVRVMRLATHHAVRSRGLGSRLLAEIRSEFAETVDWLGVSYGATPDLVEFWADNGFSTVQVSTTRNERSGEHSAIMLDPLSPAGEALYDRHGRWFRRRLPSMLADPLAGLDPDVVRALLGTVGTPEGLDLTDWEWRHLIGLSRGLAQFDTAPRPLRRLVAYHLASDTDDVLSARRQRLLVRKVLQAHSWEAVRAELDYHGRSECMRELGRAVEPLLERHADPATLSQRGRFG